MRHSWFGVIVWVVLAGLTPAAAKADTNTWLLTTGTGDWFGDTNWSLNHYPQAGEDVVITNAGIGVMLTNSTEYLNSFMISNTARLVFSNWDTTLSATNVTIKTNAIVTCAGPFTNAPDMSNRVYVVCSNMTISAGGRIDVNAKGYSGGTNNSGTTTPGTGQGPGGGLGRCGGGYGGVGGIGGVNAYGGMTYESPDAPISPGSGGGGAIQSSASPGAHGGGAVRIQATGTVTVNGTITANGRYGDSNHGGGGSGGGISVSCMAFAGTNGVMTADGGVGSYSGGGGGGGRIAVSYSSSAQSKLPAPSVYFSVLSGYGNSSVSYGDLGTLWFTNAMLLTQTIGTNAICNGQVIIPGFTNWSPSALSISNGWVRFPMEGFQLTVSNDVMVTGSSGKLELGGNQGTNTALRYHPYNASNGPAMRVLGNLILTNGGSLVVYSGITPQGGSPATSNGALVDISGTMFLGSNCWVYPYSHPTNGGSALFTMRDLTISATNSGFNADAKGYLGGTNTPAAVAGGAGYGTGGGLGLCGGGYGGVGGRTGGGGTYGSSNAPVDPGSGGGGAMQNGPPSSPPGAQGGGTVRIRAGGTVMLNGIITANGGDGASNHGGGGSGGGVYVYCRTFAGNNAKVRANGGNAANTGGSGGGGRIAIWRMNGRDFSTGISNSAAGGTSSSYPGANGTIVLGWLPSSGSVIMIR